MGEDEGEMKHVIDELMASKRKATRQRDNWKRRAVAYEKAIRETLADNGHLADGDDCTLIKLKRVLDDTTPARATDNQSPS